MARSHGSALKLVVLAAACALAARVCLQPVFVPPAQGPGAAAAAAAGLAPAAAALPALAVDDTSLTTAMAVLENPGLIWVFICSTVTMSIALVVWGRNGF
ncbi:unnamed protein product [Prorocentrum cordatum]|uniref:Cytochrome b6-f complex subunit PetN n=1 Tax=Prorocentrum cordatum TaxID=2364126 RepID=A0ABN9W6M9_9DINO|nr:unnamed protein product [Polarella glacialis]